MVLLWHCLWNCLCIRLGRIAGSRSSESAVPVPLLIQVFGWSSLHVSVVAFKLWLRLVLQICVGVVVLINRRCVPLFFHALSEARLKKLNGGPC